MRSSLLALAVLCTSVLASHASPITTYATPGTNPSSNGIMSTYSGVTTITFNGSTALPTGFTGGQVVNGSSPNAYGAPLNDTSNYYIVGSTPGYTGTSSFTPGGAYNYFGLYWGSMDAYNTISFLMNGTVIGSFTGTSFSAGNGSQGSAATNEYIDFILNNGATYNQVQFGTTLANFELDNVAYGNVSPAVAATPEPSSLVLLGTGLFGLVGVMRRRLA